MCYNIHKLRICRALAQLYGVKGGARHGYGRRCRRRRHVLAHGRFQAHAQHRLDLRGSARRRHAQAGGRGSGRCGHGYNAEELERHLASSGVVFLRNENYRTTHMFDSALIGLRYLRDKCRQVLFTPVDIPLFTAATVDALLTSGAELACRSAGAPAGTRY